MSDRSSAKPPRSAIPTRPRASTLAPAGAPEPGVAPVAPRPPDADNDAIGVGLGPPQSLIDHPVSPTPATTDTVQYGRDALATLILRARRRRRATFPGIRFGDPSWDMILDLYVTTHRSEQIDVTSLCLASGGAVTTAFRHVKTMVRCGYLVCQSDTRDKRRKFVVMTPRLEDAIDRWLDREAAAFGLRA